jgi:hypothetical protein
VLTWLMTGRPASAALRPVPDDLTSSDVAFVFPYRCLSRNASSLRLSTRPILRRAMGTWMGSAVTSIGRVEATRRTSGRVANVDTGAIVWTLDGSRVTQASYIENGIKQDRIHRAAATRMRSVPVVK